MAKTKVVFIKDVLPHGRIGDIKDIAGGFFRNALMPQGVVALATPDRIRQAEIIRARREEAARLGRERIEVLVKGLEGVTLTFVKKANEQGGLFDALDKREILEAIHQKGFREIEEKHIGMERPFDKIGEYTLNFNFGPARPATAGQSGGENISTPSIKIIVIKEE